MEEKRAKYVEEFNSLASVMRAGGGDDEQIHRFIIAAINMCYIDLIGMPATHRDNIIKLHSNVVGNIFCHELYKSRDEHERLIERADRALCTKNAQLPEAARKPGMLNELDEKTEEAARALNKIDEVISERKSICYDYFVDGINRIENELEMPRYVMPPISAPAA